jgi:hypothetical protein
VCCICTQTKGETVNCGLSSQEQSSRWSTKESPKQCLQATPPHSGTREWHAAAEGNNFEEQRMQQVKFCCTWSWHTGPGPQCKPVTRQVTIGNANSSTGCQPRTKAIRPSNLGVRQTNSQRHKWNSKPGGLHRVPITSPIAQPSRMSQSPRQPSSKQARSMRRLPSL